MLKLREFCYNHHPSGVKILAKFASVESRSYSTIMVLFARKPAEKRTVRISLNKPYFRMKG